MKTEIIPGDLVLDGLTNKFVKVKKIEVDKRGFVTLTVDSSLFNGFRTINDVTPLPDDDAPRNGDL